MNARFPIVATLLAIALSAFGCASQPYGEPGTRWITLLDGTTGLDNWVRRGRRQLECNGRQHSSRQED